MADPVPVMVLARLAVAPGIAVPSADADVAVERGQGERGGSFVMLDLDYHRGLEMHIHNPAHPGEVMKVFRM